MLACYRIIVFFLFPFLLALIFVRKLLKKEDTVRYKEKIFASNFKVARNQKNKLFWFHVASIGEFFSIFRLLSEIDKNKKNVDFLITSGTLSSSKLIEKKIKRLKNFTHRFFPLDTTNLSEKFLNEWKPDLACFVDSEIWPNFLFKIKEKKIPLVFINARITKKTLSRWKIFNNFGKKIFSNFDLCLTASKESKQNLNELEVKNLKFIGNLKYSVQDSFNEIGSMNKKILDNYKVWCAASTHDGEDLIVLKTHLEIKKKYKNVLTIIIPRHINRSSYIKSLSDKLNFKSQILAENDTINLNTEILIINSFGVLPKFFSYCKNIFIGKSFIKKKQNVGGQNPIEAAKLGCKIFHGPYVYNFQEIYEHLKSYGITEEVNNDLELAKKIVQNFENPRLVSQQQVDLLNTYGEKILKETIKELDVYLK